MSDWLTGLEELNRQGAPAVLVTVAETCGSTPREPGAKMTVGEHEVRDTIGGGQLEHAAIESARLLLDEGGKYINLLERHALSPRFGQCCGGVARILLERIPGRRPAWLEALLEARSDRRRVLAVTPLGANGIGKQVASTPEALAGATAAVRSLAARALETGRPVFDAERHWFIDPVAPPALEIVLFGAGHVGKAVARVLATLPCSLTWVDSRGGQFPADPGNNVRTEVAPYPEAVVETCPPGTLYLVMTHSHPLDLVLCERILARRDFAYCGLIGSQSKRRNFEKRLKLKGVTESTLNRLTCPIGVPGISGKRPEEIAIAVAAEVLQVREAVRTKRAQSVSTVG